MDLSRLNFKDGLIPVIAQDVHTKEVLMLAYANELAIRKTLETGYGHYWSRSRNELWMKGGTSGNTQRIVEIRVDCDRDALLYLVEQKGNACHTGNRSCFFRRLEDEDRS
jgi:phosphoribosyl-AMP cyclohydrolase